MEILNENHHNDAKATKTIERANNRAAPRSNQNKCHKHKLRAIQSYNLVLNPSNTHRIVERYKLMLFRC